MRKVAVSIFKLVNNFKEANKKLVIVWGSEKLLKELEFHQRIQRKYLLKCLNLKNIHFVTLSL
jgi:hypothetical protein